MSRPMLKMTKREKVRTTPWTTAIAPMTATYRVTTGVLLRIASTVIPSSQGRVMARAREPSRQAMPAA